MTGVTACQRKSRVRFPLGGERSRAQILLALQRASKRIGSKRRSRDQETFSFRRSLHHTFRSVIHAFAAFCDCASHISCYLTYHLYSVRQSSLDLSGSCEIELLGRKIREFRAEVYRLFQCIYPAAQCKFHVPSDLIIVLVGQCSSAFFALLWASSSDGRVLA